MFIIPRRGQDWLAHQRIDSLILAKPTFCLIYLWPLILNDLINEKIVTTEKEWVIFWLITLGTKMTKEKYANSRSIYFPLVSFQLLNFNILLRFVSVEDATLFSMDVCLLSLPSVMCQYCDRSLGVWIRLCATQWRSEEGWLF